MSATTWIVGIGIILVLDGLAIYWFFFRRTGQAGRYGEIGLPGEATLELPAGRVRLDYRVALGIRDTSSRKLDVPDQLRVEIRPLTGGEPIPIEPPRIPTQYRSMRRRTVQVHLGKIEIPSPGQYTVSAPRAISGANDPTLLLG
jgi:hypothetical protein